MGITLILKVLPGSPHSICPYLLVMGGVGCLGLCVPLVPVICYPEWMVRLALFVGVI